MELYFGSDGFLNIDGKKISELLIFEKESETRFNLRYSNGNRVLPFSSNICDLTQVRITKQNGDQYNNVSEIETVINTFLKSLLQNNVSSSGILFTDPDTQLPARIIIRDSKMCFDSALNIETGFSGAESLDEGLTGDWVNKVEFPLY